MPHKKYLFSTTVFVMLDELHLQVDEKYLFLYLKSHKDISITGLYEITRREMSQDTGISRDRLEGCLHNLKRAELIAAYDCDLLFVPHIPEEQNLERKMKWQDTLKRMRKDKAEYRSDMPGGKNDAYQAFLKHHEERFYHIDEADRMDRELEKQSSVPSTSNIAPTSTSNVEPTSTSNVELAIKSTDAAQSGFDAAVERMRRKTQAEKDQQKRGADIASQDVELTSSVEDMSAPPLEVVEGKNGIVANAAKPGKRSKAQTDHSPNRIRDPDAVPAGGFHPP